MPRTPTPAQRRRRRVLHLLIALILLAAAWQWWELLRPRPQQVPSRKVFVAWRMQ